jgi:hypothetical protein
MDSECTVASPHMRHGSTPAQLEVCRHGKQLPSYGSYQVHSSANLCCHMCMSVVNADTMHLHNTLHVHKVDQTLCLISSCMLSEMSLKPKGVAVSDVCT